VYTKLLQKAKTDTRDRKLRLRHGLDLSESLLEDIRNSVDSGEEMSEVPQKRPETECNLADLTCHRVENAEKSSRIVQRERTDCRYKCANTNVFSSAERSDTPSEVQVQSTYQASTLDPSGTRTRRTAGRLARSKKCPACVERVINLPRHLRGKHRWTVEDSRRVVHQFGLRKPYETSHRKTIQKFRDYHRHRLCPINGCNAAVKRLSPHLRQVHGISSVSPLYTKLLQKAKAETRDHKLRLRHGNDCVTSLPLSESLLEYIDNSTVSGEEMSEIRQKRHETEGSRADLRCHRVENAEKSSRIVQREQADCRSNYANANVVSSAAHSDTTSEVQVQSAYEASTVDPSAKPTARKPAGVENADKSSRIVRREQTDCRSKYTNTNVVSSAEHSDTTSEVQVQSTYPASAVDPSAKPTAGKPAGVENAEKSSRIVRREWTDCRSRYANANVVSSAEHSDTTSEVQVQSAYEASTVDPSAKPTARKPAGVENAEKSSRIVRREQTDCRSRYANANVVSSAEHSDTTSEVQVQSAYEASTVDPSAKPTAGKPARVENAEKSSRIVRREWTDCRNKYANANVFNSVEHSDTTSEVQVQSTYEASTVDPSAKPKPSTVENAELRREKRCVAAARALAVLWGQSQTETDSSLPPANDCSAQQISSEVQTPASDEAPGDIMPSSTQPDRGYKLHSIFSSEDVKFLKQTFRESIRSGHIAQDQAKSTLAKSATGDALLKSFSIYQIISRLKYERRKLIMSLPRQ